jgi:hypothetical protein
LRKEQAHLVAVTGREVVVQPDHVPSFVEDPQATRDIR